jgi:hypothetical protein
MLDNEYSMLREFANFLFTDGNSIEKVHDAIEKMAKAADEKRQARLNPPLEEVAEVEVEQNTEALAA